MNIGTIIQQSAIAILGSIAIYYAQFIDHKKRRWAYLFGLLNQPFWYWMCIETKKWGLFALCTFYTYSWARGFISHWITYREEEYHASTRKEKS